MGGKDKVSGKEVKSGGCVDTWLTLIMAHVSLTIYTKRLIRVELGEGGWGRKGERQGSITSCCSCVMEYDCPL